MSKRFMVTVALVGMMGMMLALSSVALAETSSDKPANNWLPSPEKEKPSPPHLQEEEKPLAPPPEKEKPHQPLPPEEEKPHHLPQPQEEKKPSRQHEEQQHREKLLPEVIVLPLEIEQEEKKEQQHREKLLPEVTVPPPEIAVPPPKVVAQVPEVTVPPPEIVVPPPPPAKAEAKAIPAPEAQAKELPKSGGGAIPLLGLGVLLVTGGLLVRRISR
jgi:hypothetical protein